MSDLAIFLGTYMKGTNRDAGEGAFKRLFITALRTLEKHCVGQKIHLGFSVRCYGKPLTDFFTNTICPKIKLFKYISSI